MLCHWLYQTTHIDLFDGRLFRAGVAAMLSIILVLFFMPKYIRFLQRLDATSDFDKDGKTKLSNLPPMLDRWFVRRILQNDFSFFFKYLPSGQDFKKRSRRITFSPEGEVTLLNKRFKLKYTFTPIIDEE